MGRALEVIAGQVTAPGATFTPLNMAAGNSLTIRNAPLDSKVLMLQSWVQSQAGGVLRIRSPKLHDNVQGFRVVHTATNVKPLFPLGIGQKLMPQDELVAELTGSGTVGDAEGAAMLIYYENLPGTEARFASIEDVNRRGANLLTVENTLSLGTTGGWTAEESISTEFDLLKANTDYALIGYLVNAECVAVRWRGSDLGNLGVGGPGDPVGRDITANWFLDLSRAFGMPLIPILNSANKGGILIDGMQNENGTDVTLSSLLVEIGPTK